MRFPFALSAKIAGHIIKHKLRKTPKFAMVLQLEPLHTCNLTCTGCGRIREYSTILKDMVPLEKCLAAAQECDAPMVSICGGEPLIYPKIEELIAGLLQQGRVLYVCTNGVFMRKKMREYLAAIYSPAIEPKLKKLLDQKLISEKDAETIRKSDDAARKKIVIRPTQWMYWNVHVDGLEFTHDLIVEREGVFKECIEAIKMAKILGYQVATNTTVYKETDMQEIEDMFKFLSSLGRGRPHDFARLRLRRGQEGHGQAPRQGPEGFLPDARHDAAEIREDSGLGQGVHDFRHAGVSGISRRQTRADLHRVGDSDLQHQGLESAVLPDDRRPLRRLSGTARQRWNGKNTAS